MPFAGVVTPYRECGGRWFYVLRRPHGIGTLGTASPTDDISNK